MQNIPRFVSTNHIKGTIKPRKRPVRINIFIFNYNINMPNRKTTKENRKVTLPCQRKPTLGTFCRNVTIKQKTQRSSNSLYLNFANFDFHKENHFGDYTPSTHVEGVVRFEGSSTPKHSNLKFSFRPIDIPSNCR